MSKTGIYIHTPFCVSKCPYCDFYSLKCTPELLCNYIYALKKEIKQKALKYGEISADTVYFGGGSPKMLGLLGINEILKTLFSYIKIDPSSEITVELNPERETPVSFYKELRNMGVNRISMGMQSSIDSELKLLGRRNRREDTLVSFSNATSGGIDNISLDILLGIPAQTKDSAVKSIEFANELGAKHISSYMLKIEEGTKFYAIKDKLNLMSDDEYADIYLLSSEKLKTLGYKQYEISNFCKDGFESKHNLKYWKCAPYLGFGPSAHSFYENVRFYNENDINGYILGAPSVFEDNFGGESEYLMLKLRLSEGVSLKEFASFFGNDTSYFENTVKKAEKYIDMGFMKYENECLSFTLNGFLISNTILAEILS